MSDRYVQSKYSKDAPIYKVAVSYTGYDDLWTCHYEQAKTDRDCCWLPKSEYVEVPAPERWEDVTAHCVIDDYENRVGAFWSIVHTTVGGKTGWNVMSKLNEGYRIRKVSLETPHVCGETLAAQAMAFIIERKVNP